MPHVKQASTVVTMAAPVFTHTHTQTDKPHTRTECAKAGRPACMYLCTRSGPKQTAPAHTQDRIATAVRVRTEQTEWCNQLRRAGFEYGHKQWILHTQNQDCSRAYEVGVTTSSDAKVLWRMDALRRQIQQPYNMHHLHHHYLFSPKTQTVDHVGHSTRAHPQRRMASQLVEATHKYSRMCETLLNLGAHAHPWPQIQNVSNCAREY